MDLTDAIIGRRSVRKYADRVVPHAAVERLIDLARHAPSSLNGQPWHFVIVRDQRTKDTLASIKNTFCPPAKQAYPADFLRDAPIVLVVCVESDRSFDRAIENSVFAASLIMLGAHAQGLSAVYMSAYTAGVPDLAAEIKRALCIPAGIEPVSIIPLGYAAESATPKALRPLPEMVHVDRF